ncbi:MAG TPA: D-alanine--D-alanine ligase [Chitinivibrionales bacterium]
MKLPLAVVMGGVSAEHEISLLSGHQVLVNLDKSKYEIRAIIITKNNRYYYRDLIGGVAPSLEAIEALDGLASPFRSHDFKGPLTPHDGCEVWAPCKAAFLALHGDTGEDGRIQGFLDVLGIPYNGSGVLASALAMNKILSKYLFLQNGIPTPPFSVYGRSHPETSVELMASRHGFPCFVKCPQSGSSRLMDRAADRERLESLLVEYSASADEILVETAVQGPEYTCPVLEYPDGRVEALPPIEIKPRTAAFFDFNAKYADNGSEEIVPAPCGAALTKRIQDSALKAHTLLGCRGVSRTDMILNGDTLYVLEVNTLPGLTANSLLPKSFKSLGGTYPELLDILIQTGAYQTRGNAL